MRKKQDPRTLVLWNHHALGLTFRDFVKENPSEFLEMEITKGGFGMEEAVKTAAANVNQVVFLLLSQREDREGFEEALQLQVRLLRQVVKGLKTGKKGRLFYLAPAAALSVKHGPLNLQYLSQGQDLHSPPLSAAVLALNELRAIKKLPMEVCVLLSSEQLGPKGMTPLLDKIIRQTPKTLAFPGFFHLCDARQATETIASLLQKKPLPPAVLLHGHSLSWQAFFKELSGSKSLPKTVQLGAGQMKTLFENLRNFSGIDGLKDLSPPQSWELLLHQKTLVLAEQSIDQPEFSHSLQETLTWSR